MNPRRRKSDAQIRDYLAYRRWLFVRRFGCPYPTDEARIMLYSDAMNPKRRKTAAQLVDLSRCLQWQWDRLTEEWRAKTGPEKIVSILDYDTGLEYERPGFNLP